MLLERPWRCGFFVGAGKFGSGLLHISAVVETFSLNAIENPKESAYHVSANLLYIGDYTTQLYGEYYNPL